MISLRRSRSVCRLFAALRFCFLHIARDLTERRICSSVDPATTVTIDYGICFRWIAEHQPRSYGLLHVRDDENADGYDNAFVVHVMKRGSLSSSTDSNLSPCILELE